MTPLVSIITPCYNAQEYIEETITSVQAQSYTNWEMIIINDNSSDESQMIIEKYMQLDARIKTIFNIQNRGAAQSRNAGIKAAIGKYIAFLDSDDCWMKEKLQKQIELMERGNVALSYSGYYTINEKGVRLSKFEVPTTVTYADMLKTSHIGTLTTIYNVQSLKKIYFKDTPHEDYVLKLDILKKIPYAVGINVPLAKYRIHKQGLSHNKFKTALWQWNIYRNIEKFSLWKSIYFFIHYAYFGFFKYKT